MRPTIEQILATGEHKSKKIAMSLISEAKDILSGYGRNAIYLNLLTDYILDRKK